MDKKVTVMDELSFENALKELEEIVGKLEKGGLSLNQSLALFERGVKLARFLRQELEKAEKKIEILLQDEKGEVKKESFDLQQKENVSSKEEGTSDKEEDDDVPF